MWSCGVGFVGLLVAASGSVVGSESLGWVLVGPFQVASGYLHTWSVCCEGLSCGFQCVARVWFAGVGGSGFGLGHDLGFGVARPGLGFC